jgi:hypothetical protein
MLRLWELKVFKLAIMTSWAKLVMHHGSFDSKTSYSKKCIPLHGPRSKQKCDGRLRYHSTRTIKSDDDH